MRDYKIDNMKGILILLVVFGHLLELSLGYGIHKILHVIIYSFHMPLFVFTTGYFANYSLKKISGTLLYPYFIFQTLYLLFDRVVLGNAVSIQYGKPYWILWYLLAAAVWMLFMPLIARVKYKGALLFLSCVISLLAGYVNEIGRELSLSRILVFFPFFLFGLFSREWKLPEKLQKKYFKISLGILAGISAVYWLGSAKTIKLAWLYEATSYTKGGYSFFFRGLHLFMAVSILLFALAWIPNRKMRLLSEAGQKTLPIFLMHGFIIRLIGKYEVFQTMKHQTIVMLLLTITIVIVLQSEPVIRLFSPLMKWNASLGSHAFSSKQEKGK